MILALNILWTGKHLVRESIGGLMNEQDRSTIEEIARAIDSQRRLNAYWIDLHSLRYWKSGDRFIIDFHLTVPFYSPVEESHNEFDKLETLLKDRLDSDVEVLMHLDPCKKYFCSICRKEDCSYRSEEQKSDVIWDSSKVIADTTYILGEVAAGDK
jgi:divalent metal cation (Fe/Co/Zn/Cd) transporter